MKNRRGRKFGFCGKDQLITASKLLQFANFANWPRHNPPKYQLTNLVETFSHLAPEVDGQDIACKSFLDATEKPTSGTGLCIPRGAGFKLFGDPEHLALHLFLSQHLLKVFK